MTKKYSYTFNQKVARRTKLPTGNLQKYTFKSQIIISLLSIDKTKKIYGQKNRILVLLIQHISIIYHIVKNLDTYMILWFLKKLEIVIFDQIHNNLILISGVKVFYYFFIQV
ncbi:hypothetical protein EDEG_04095 [Edhazardia aedis USNM 41457]|uniref:Uncharacterized protein n=1 Tax=Edhazardia aedis (strain USNM 41457) TaxID=1003232 RepID=J9DCS0_EDHAE|nr:hypothetical protein EDEG_04095 [Edhazardia aedis USNM 41457]|eukprot:EJW05264.1 hypothetical protein EDEG_04095 [Edhazardia aedis USNM 41457]